jgi:hypothetical protein
MLNSRTATGAPDPGRKPSTAPTETPLQTGSGGSMASGLGLLMSIYPVMTANLSPK